MQWISVKDRLPEPGSYVWVYVQWDAWDNIYRAKYPWRILDEYVEDHEQEEEIARITHWFSRKEIVNADISMQSNVSPI